jgi:hypothetical protein
LNFALCNATEVIYIEFPAGKYPDCITHDLDTYLPKSIILYQSCVRPSLFRENIFSLCPVSLCSSCFQNHASVLTQKFEIFMLTFNQILKLSQSHIPYCSLLLIIPRLNILEYSNFGSIKIIVNNQIHFFFFKEAWKDTIHALLSL